MFVRVGFNPTLGRLATSRMFVKTEQVEIQGFNPTLGRLATSSHLRLGPLTRTPKFQSHSGTIGHFKGPIALDTAKYEVVSIPLWDDWALQEVANPRICREGPEFQSHSGTIGHFKATSAD